MIVTYQNTGIPGCLPPRSTPYKTGSSPHEKNAGAEKCVLFVSASEKTKNEKYGSRPYFRDLDFKSYMQCLNQLMQC